MRKSKKDEPIDTKKEEEKVLLSVNQWLVIRKIRKGEWNARKVYAKKNEKITLPLTQWDEFFKQY